MSFTDINNELSRSGGPIIKLDNVGDHVVFDVVEAEYRQKTNFETQEPMTFPDGKPKMQLVLTVHRDGVDEEERVFLHWTAERSLGKWLKDKGERLERGSRIKLTRLADVPSTKRGMAASRAYSVEHKPAPIAQPSASDF